MPATGDGRAMYGAIAQFYDRMYSWKSYRAEAAELHRIARRRGLTGGRSLLDVGCGTGHHLEEFQRWYPDLAGVDQSPAMLRIARGRLGKAVPLTRADMRAFDLGRTFDVVVCLFSAFGYMQNRRDRDRATAAMARHVNPGGVVMVEGWILPERWRGNSSHLLTYEDEDLKLARLNRSTRRGGRSVLDMHYLIAVPGRPVRHVHETHLNPLVPAEETLGSFRRAGLRASVLRSGRWRDRGLFIGVAPAVPASGRE